MSITTGAVRRTLTVADLNVPDADVDGGGAHALHANTRPLVPADFVGLAGVNLAGNPLGVTLETHLGGGGANVPFASPEGLFASPPPARDNAADQIVAHDQALAAWDAELIGGRLI